ncbi:ABC transporter ATP-binding protein [Olsenella sp. HMSC062G07]|uniref:ABC transporter ATP-binding protein n=1 Tax=Olsenella sp. HMSC062G07 TaxID=1739330 RepID=UPI0008A291C0|nr:ABC transporter ATP-binding protein [Olsenella sp. HMSC062G07]OFK22288.1 ABC transporter [Olsenella sp. HMSC062G07]
MAEVTLRHIQKVYPNAERGSKARKGKGRLATNLKVTDEGVVAVDDFNLDIADREFVVLVGPSGCGKSTTLRMVAGLEEISGGELSIDGRPMNDVPAKDRDIAMVFQSYALYPHMSVYDNLAFPLKLRKLPASEIDEKVREAAQILGITEYLHRKPKALSGGQRQRVAIGRAIVRNPKVLLMDEPLSNLDAKLRNQMRAELIKLRQSINTTFIYVTHDQTEAMTLGDRIVIMKDGVVQQVGTPQEVFDRPQNIFVAGFIGVPQMNFFDATLSVKAGRVSLAAPGYDAVVPADVASRIEGNGGADGQDVTVGVRPEQLVISKSGEAGALSGFVEVTELMGSTVHVHATTELGPFVLVVPTVDLGGASYLPGTPLSFRCAPGALHVFDRATGESLTR